MASAGILITQKLLAGAGGWNVMKAAQQLQKAGRVTDAAYNPPHLSGMVREGNRNLRSGLRVKTETDVENACTCRESREWGTICAHAVAVGLAYLESFRAEPPAKSRDPVASPIALPPDSSAPLRSARDDQPMFVELGRANAATPIALHFILPPNFESAWAKGQIMLVTEVELGGKRAMPSTLNKKEMYGCDAHDLAALDGLQQAAAGSEPPLAPMCMFQREEFLRLLRSLSSHPRITFGKATAVEVAAAPCRPRIVLKRAAESLSLRLAPAGTERLLLAAEEAWVLRAKSFQPLIEDIPTELRQLADGELTLRGENAQRFLAFEAAQLGRWFEVEADGAFTMPDVETARPAIVLNAEGSLREIRAELRAKYADGTKPITAGSTASQESFIRDPDKPGVIFLRDVGAEQAALTRLEKFGFAWRGDRLVLTNENLVARFFAFEFPRLKAEWEVQLSAQASKASSELQPLTPKLEIVGSGEDWFELQYSLGTPDGQLFSAAELQRLLRSGQSKTRLRNGRTGVFDAEAISDFEEVLRDVDPSQSQPGTYRIKRAQANYIAATAGEVGAQLGDLRGALQRFAGGASGAVPELGALAKQLRHYQTEGVSWLWRLAESNLGGILADEMGLGKTVQTLAYLLARRAVGPALIVCPTSLITNWRNEAQRFTPALRVLVLEGPERHADFAKIAASDLVLTSYALLQRDADKYKALEFSTVVLDEAQHIKNPDTQNAQAAFALRARHRFVLTGTPMENSVRDLWSLMNFVLPGYLGSRTDFRERYEQPLARGAAPEVQRRLSRRLRPFLLRRKKSDVAKDLPEKLEQVLMCDLNPPQRAAYDGLLREVQSGLTTENGNAGAVRMKMLLGLLRLRQVCCDLRLLGPGSAGAPPALFGASPKSSSRAEVSREARDTAGEAPALPTPPNAELSAKLALFDELLEQAIDGGHRVLLFSQFVSMLTLIRERLEADSIRFSYLDGQTKERQAVVDQFQRDAAIPIFLMSLKAGGVGLNLSAADTVIHFDPWWNYAAESQATDRAHRIGQTRVVTAYKLIARNTVEEKILKLQARKRSASEGVIGSEEPLMSGLTTEDLEELLS